jgi:ABC-2 type transport system permease protein
VSRGRTWAVAAKEVRFILRDPRSLGVALLLPLVLLVLYGYAINFDVKGIGLALYDPDPTEASRDLVAALTRTGYFRLVKVLPRSDGAERSLQTRAARVVLILPVRFGADLAAGRPTSVQTLIDGSDSLTASISLSYLEAMIQDWWLRRAAGLATQSLRGSSPVLIEPQVRIWYNEDLSSTNFIIPGLLVVILMMLAALLTSQTIVREREQGTIEGLVVSPVTAGELIAGKLLPYVGIAWADVALIAGAGSLLFHVPMRGQPALFLTLTFVYLLAALGAGLLISVSTRSQQLAYMVALIATLLPTMLLTGFVFPLSSMPRVLQMIVQLHPATHFMVIARAMMLKGAGWHALWPRALALTAIAATLVLGSIKKFRKTL